MLFNEISFVVFHQLISPTLTCGFTVLGDIRGKKSSKMMGY